MPNLKEGLKCIIHLEMINSDSLKMLTQLIFKMNVHFENGVETHIKWIYNEDDENIYENGKQLEEMTNIPFEFEVYYE